MWYGAQERGKKEDCVGQRNRRKSYRRIETRKKALVKGMVTGENSGNRAKMREASGGLD